MNRKLVLLILIKLSVGIQSIILSKENQEIMTTCVDIKAFTPGG